MELYDAVIDSLSNISQWVDRETGSNATQLLCSIQNPEFIVSVHVAQNIFSVTAPLSRFLQSPQLDLASALAFANAVEEKLMTSRNNAEGSISTNIW